MNRDRGDRELVGDTTWPTSTVISWPLVGIYVFIICIIIHYICVISICEYLIFWYFTPILSWSLYRYSCYSTCLCGKSDPLNHHHYRRRRCRCCLSAPHESNIEIVQQKTIYQHELTYPFCMAWYFIWIVCKRFTRFFQPDFLSKR